MPRAAGGGAILRHCASVADDRRQIAVLANVEKSQQHHKRPTGNKMLRSLLHQGVLTHQHTCAEMTAAALHREVQPVQLSRPPWRPKIGRGMAGQPVGGSKVSSAQNHNHNRSVAHGGAKALHHGMRPLGVKAHGGLIGILGIGTRRTGVIAVMRI